MSPTGPRRWPPPPPPLRPPAGRRTICGPGHPIPPPFPRPAWLAATRKALATAPAEALGYTDPQGRPELRQALAGYLARARGVQLTPDRLVIRLPVAPRPARRRPAPARPPGPYHRYRGRPPPAARTTRRPHRTRHHHPRRPPRPRPRRARLLPANPRHPSARPGRRLRHTARTRLHRRRRPPHRRPQRSARGWRWYLVNAGRARPMTAAPATVTSPPASALITGEVSEPSAPASRLPSEPPLTPTT